MAFRKFAALIALLAVCACARMLPGALKCSANGGPQWHEYRSRHFDVFTDLDRADAASLVNQLETLEGTVIRAVSGEDLEPPGRLRVVVPAEERTYLTIAPYSAVGYFMMDWLFEPTIVLHPAALRLEPEVVAHELVHHLSWFIFPRQPFWFSEGIAQFFQTVANPDPKYHGAAGLVPRLRAERLRHPSQAQQIPVRELLAWGGAYDVREPDLPEFWSWVLYHWLWNERPKQLADYQRRLEEAQDPAAAWAAAFPEFDPATPGALEKLDDTLDQHRRRGDLTFYKVEAHADVSFTEAAVPPAEVHMLMLATRVRWNENDPFYFGGPLIDSQQSFTRNEAAEALREDPANPVATYLAHGNGHKPSADDMRKTTAAHPSDWRAFYLLARTLERDDQWPAKETALREAVRLNPDSAAANNQLAWSLVTHGQAKEALPFANRATELAPGDAAIVDTLAAVAFRLDACPKAIVLQKRAVALLPERGDSSIRGHLRDYEQRCGRVHAPAAATHR